MKKKARRSKRSAAARMRPFWILILVLLCAGAAGGYYAANWPGFRLAHVTVTGNLRVPRQEIVARAAILSGQNLWLQSMTAAAARVKAIPYVDDVRMHRALPAELTIAVTERKPFAIVRDGSGTFLIDRAIRVLEPGPGDTPGLPVFVELTAQMPAPGAFVRDRRLAALVADYQTLLGAHVVARQLEFDRLGNLTAVVGNGIAAELGDDADLAAKAPLIDPILSQTQRDGKRVRAVDLRAPKTPVVVYK